MEGLEEKYLGTSLEKPREVPLESLQRWKGERRYVLPLESFIDYVKHPQVRRLYLTDVGFFPNARYHHIKRNKGIEEYILFFCMDGTGTVIIDGRKMTLKKNQALCIPRYKWHHYYASEENPWSLLWVHFKGEDVGYYPLEECRLVEFTSQSALGRIQLLFEQMFRVLDGNYTLGNFIYISQTLAMILSETYNRDNNDTTQEQNKHVTKVVKYMYSHIDENLTLEQIADEFELSKSYLNAIFQKYTRHAPMNFFINLKMKKACDLLREFDYHVYEVAQWLGYSDQYYFSRIFKRVVGMSPKEYKNSDHIHYTEERFME